MRSAFFGLALAIASLVALALPSEAQAQWMPRTSAYPGLGGLTYYPPAGYYGYYQPPYYWYGNQYSTPYQNSWYYQRYYPYTNQYYYQYGVSPQYHWWY